MVRRAVTQKATDTMNFNIDQAIIEWKAEKIAEKFYAKWRAGEATDADTAEYHNRYNIARAEATTQPTEVVEVVEEVSIKDAVESITYTLTDAGHLVANFGEAWGADGQVLTHDETAEAIKTGKGWFDRQGRWVNKAGWEKKHAYLSDWLTAKLAAN